MWRRGFARNFKSGRRAFAENRRNKALSRNTSYPKATER
jgi:hypothetical protein